MGTTETPKSYSSTTAELIERSKAIIVQSKEISRTSRVLMEQLTVRLAEFWSQMRPAEGDRSGGVRS